MNISYRIVQLRKQQGWSQEELAERLDVSRQSVSKWESGTSIPDINKILQLSEIFGVTTDYLLKNEDKQDITPPGHVLSDKHVLSDEEVIDFMNANVQFGRKVAAGVVLCILSPAVLISLSGFSAAGFVSEALFVNIGMLVLLTMVAVAVMIFIRSGITIGRYKYIREGDFSLTPAQMSSMENMLKEFEPGFGRRIAVGVGMCIFSPFPLITTSVIGASAVIVLLMVPVLLMMVAVAVHEFVRLGVIREGYLQLMKKEDFDPVKKLFS